MIVLGTALVTQGLQTIQIAILRRDVRRSMRPPTEFRYETRVREDNTPDGRKGKRS
jgi:hypothetical protein